MKIFLYGAALVLFFFQNSFAQNNNERRKLSKNGLPAGVSATRNLINKDHITVTNSSGVYPAKNNSALMQKTAKSNYPEWYYIRPDKTGVGGDYHYTVNGDRFGNIWMGGFMVFWEQGSVIRYDGNVFTDWGSYDGYLPSARVTKIAFDKTDHLWVGTDEGISTYDNKKWTQYTLANSNLIYDQVTGMAVDNNNHIWVTMSKFGSIGVGEVAYFNGKKWINFTTGNSGLPTPNVFDIAIDKNNIKWIASDVGLIRFDGINWKVYNNNNSGLSGFDASDVEIDSLNRVWVTSGGGIDIFNGTKWSHVPRTGWPASFEADQLFIRGKKVIVSDVAYAVLTYDGSTWKTHYTDNLVFDDYIDTKGNYWAAGIGFVTKFEGTRDTAYTRYNTELAEYFNNDVYIDSNNKWFANGNGGIQNFNCPKWEAYGPWNGGLFPIPETFTTIGTSVTQDSYGDLWMTYDGTFGYAVQIPKANYSNYSAWKTWSDTNTTFGNFQILEEVEATTKGKVFFRNYFGYIFMYDHATAIAIYRPGGVLGFDCIDTTIQIGNTNAISLNEESVKNISGLQLSVSPNPAKDFLIINAPSFNGKVELRIYDAVGKMVLSKDEKYLSQTRLKIGDLNKGIYILNITDDKGNTATVKWMKE